MTDAARRPAPDPALVRALERCEIDVWRDLYAAPPGDVAGAAGLRVDALDGAALFLAPAFDVLALNRLVGLGVEEPASEAQLDAALDAAARAGVRRLFVQVVPTAEPAALDDWLAARGLVPYNAWVRLARPVAPVDDPPTPLRVAEIGPADAATFGRIAAGAFGWPALLERWTAASVGREGWRHYLAYDGDEPVATGAFRLRGGEAWFGFAATVERHRGRGAQGALLARRLRDAAAMGARRASLETAQPTPQRAAPSFRNVQRAGFATVYLRRNWLHAPASA
ncbi:MAG TPA: GNAT family N-acetyltransferase [Gemmatimonadaceae bacterium]|nr:GNAT family N-acetyltransferase [Gemmatimonadaceae bacterium]